MLRLVVVLLCGMIASPVIAQTKSDTSAVASQLKSTKSITSTEYISPALQPTLAGHDIAGELGLPSTGFLDLGLKIDQARMQADLIGLGALAVELRYLEQISGRKSSLVTSDELDKEASAIAKQRVPYALHPVAQKSADLSSQAIMLHTQIAPGRDPAVAAVFQNGAAGVPSKPAVPLPGDPGPAVSSARPDPNPSPSPSSSGGTDNPRPRGAADVRGMVAPTAEDEFQPHPGIPNVAAYVQVANQTDMPLHIVIDGTYYCHLEGGMYNTYALHPGIHNIKATSASAAGVTKVQELNLGDTLYLNVAPTQGSK